MGTQKTGDEHIRFGGMPTGYLLSDFWRWSSSDLLNNTLRGTYSEFIVAAALGLDLSGGFEDWLPWDLTYPFQWKDISGTLHDDIRIEVKSSAYLQSWNDDKLSNIIFSIRKAHAWDAKKGFYGEFKRQSDVYVFCLYAETNRRLADPLILDGWEFYILSTNTLDKICGDQKTISLNPLRQLHPIKVDYSGIKDAIVQCVQNKGLPPPEAYYINLLPDLYIFILSYYDTAHKIEVVSFCAFI